MGLVENEERITERTARMSERSGLDVPADYRLEQQFWQEYRGEMTLQRPDSRNNVGPDERAVSVAAGAIVSLLGLSHGTLPGLLGAGIGAFLVYRGITGRCALYHRLGINTAQPDGDALEQSRGIEISTAMTIRKPAADLYRFWRDFTNLPRIMPHLESVAVFDDRRSHWIAKAPRLVGGKVEWDAEVTRDEPDRLIAWRSLPGSTIDTAGQVRFEKAPGDRGTEVHVWMNYTPPGGTLGHLITAMLGENPKRIVREELRNLQRLMEVGEILSIDGQPHGTCAGQGKPYHESSWKPLFT